MRSRWWCELLGIFLQKLKGLEAFYNILKNCSDWTSKVDMANTWIPRGLLSTFKCWVFSLYSITFCCCIFGHLWTRWGMNPWLSNGEGLGQVQFLSRIFYGVYFIHQYVHLIFFSLCHCLLLSVVLIFWSAYLIHKGVDFTYFTADLMFFGVFSYILDGVSYFHT